MVTIKPLLKKTIAGHSIYLSEENKEDFQKDAEAYMTKGLIQGYLGNGNIVEAEKILNSQEGKALDPGFYNTAMNQLKHKKSPKERRGAVEASLEQAHRTGDLSVLFSLSKHTGNPVFAKLVPMVRSSIMANKVPGPITITQQTKILNAIPQDSRHGPSTRKAFVSFIKKK